MAEDPTVPPKWLSDWDWKVLNQSVLDAIRIFSDRRAVVLDQVTRWLAEHEAQMRACVESINSWPARAKQAWGVAVNQGWYMSPTAPIVAVKVAEQGGAVLDQYMLVHLQEDWNELTESLLAQFPERAEILSTAFKLHLERNYIAAIPLFLAQADGICAQSLGAYLFTELTKKDAAIKERLAQNPDDWTAILLHLLGEKTQIMSGIAKASPERKALGPNRSGILHGSRKHLDYGTELNSYKAFSLLCFVAWCFEGGDQAGSSVTPAASG